MTDQIDIEFRLTALELQVREINRWMKEREEGKAHVEPIRQCSCQSHPEHDRAGKERRGS